MSEYQMKNIDFNVRKVLNLKGNKKSTFLFKKKCSEISIISLWKQKFYKGKY